MSLSSHAVFPQIICERIIDHLFDDRRALANCILVCREWVEPCRCHFFSQMILTRKNWRAFHDHLHAYARYLLIKEPKNPPPEKGQLTVLQTLRMISSGLWDILKDLCGPTTIFIDDLMLPTFAQVSVLSFEPPFTCCHPEVTERRQPVRGLTSAFPRVRVLEIQHNAVCGYDRPWEDTIQLICGFRELEVLTLGYLDHSVQGNLQGCWLPPRLRTLNFSWFSQPTSLFLDLLYSMDPPPKITTFRIAPSSVNTHTPLNDIDRISTLLSDQGKYIQRLEFIRYEIGSPNSSDLLKLLYPLTCAPAVAESMPRITEQNTALRSLVIPVKSPHLYICHLPVYIKNTSLEEVRILFRVEFEEMWGIWTSLDQLIFQSLAENPRERFTLHLDMSRLSQRWWPSRSHQEQLARSLFPLCNNELGILKCVFDDANRRGRGPVLSRLRSLGVDDLICIMIVSTYFRHPSN